MTERAYCRVYYSIKDDEKFKTIRGDDHHLATWLRLLMAADAIWPASPDLPAAARRASVRALVAAELVDILPDGMYRIRGLDAERGARREAARVSAGHRTPSERSPNAPANANRTPTSHSEPSQAETKPSLAKPSPRVTPVDRTPPRPTKLPVTLTKEQLEAWESFGPAWAPFKAAWLSRGFLYPPSGEPDDDDTSQRGLLWQIVDARPSGIAEWVRAAPKGSTARAVVQYVLDRFHEVRQATLEEPPPRDLAPTRKEAAEVLGAVLARVVPKDAA